MTGKGDGYNTAFSKATACVVNVGGAANWCVCVSLPCKESQGTGATLSCTRIIPTVLLGARPPCSSRVDNTKVYRRFFLPIPGRGPEGAKRGEIVSKNDMRDRFIYLVLIQRRPCTKQPEAAGVMYYACTRYVAGCLWCPNCKALSCRYTTRAHQRGWMDEWMDGEDTRAAARVACSLEQCTRYTLLRDNRSHSLTHSLTH